MFERGPWLGEVPLIPGYFWRGSFINPGPAARLGPPLPMTADGFPPYYGQWGVVDSSGNYTDSGQVGPFDTIDEAFNAAANAASAAGARKMPLDGFAQVKDSRGNPVGPII